MTVRVADHRHPLAPRLHRGRIDHDAAARDTAGLRIGNLDLSTDAIAANATANITSGASQAQFDFDLTDLGLAFPELSGPGTVTGTFNREANGAATLDADATLPGARVTLNATEAASTVGPDGDRELGLGGGRDAADLQARAGRRALRA